MSASSSSGGTGWPEDGQSPPCTMIRGCGRSLYGQYHQRYSGGPTSATGLTLCVLFCGIFMLCLGCGLRQRQNNSEAVRHTAIANRAWVVNANASAMKNLDINTSTTCSNEGSASAIQEFPSGKWRGHYYQCGTKYEMSNLIMSFAGPTTSHGLVTGSGRDNVGPYTLAGTFHTGSQHAESRLEFIKQYQFRFTGSRYSGNIGQSVAYRGAVAQGYMSDGVRGSWLLSHNTHERGTFHIRPTQCSTTPLLVPPSIALGHPCLSPPLPLPLPLPLVVVNDGGNGNRDESPSLV